MQTLDYSPMPKHVSSGISQHGMASWLDQERMVDISSRPEAKVAARTKVSIKRRIGENMILL